MLELKTRCVLILTLLFSSLYAHNTPKAHSDAVCRLLQLTQNQHIHDCCTPPLVNSRQDLCEKNQQSSHSDILDSNPTLHEYKFVIEIMKQVVDESMLISESDIDGLSAVSLSMDKVCPTSNVYIPKGFYMEFFKRYLYNVDLKNVIIKTVSYFSKRKRCTVLPDIDANLGYDESRTKELLNRMLFQIYQGIPFCESDSKIEVKTNPIKPYRFVSRLVSAFLHNSKPNGIHRMRSGPVKKSGVNSEGLRNSVNSYSPGYKGWLATFVAIIIISVVSVSMIAIVGLRKNIKVYRYCLEFFVASAVAALLTDSLLHLYPESLGVHVHDNSEDHDHDNEDSIYSPSNYLWKGIIMIATIYIFYMIEYLMLVVPKFLGVSGQRHHHHHHHHDHFHQATQDNDKDPNVCEKRKSYTLINGDSTQPPNVDCKVVCKVDDHIAQHRVHSGVPIDCIEHIQEVHAIELTEIDMDNHDHHRNHHCGNQTTHYVDCDNVNPNSNELDSNANTNPTTTTTTTVTNTNENVCDSKKSGFLAELRNVDKVVWMLTIGDALHNCIDGIFIATQFMENWPKGFFTGVMTSVAILCHEVPHEVGDYAAMLSSGLSIKKAVFFNFIATLSCLLGGVIGCFLGSSGRSPWIEPIVAGIFIYVSLTILMPNLIKSLENAKSPLKLFLCHTFGYLFGSTVLVAIAFHEESLIHMWRP